MRSMAAVRRMSSTLDFTSSWNMSGCISNSLLADFLTGFTLESGNDHHIGPELHLSELSAPRPKALARSIAGPMLSPGQRPMVAL